MLLALRTFWSDEQAFIVSSELILVAATLVIGMLAGLATIRDQVVQELGDVAAALSRSEQTFSFSGVTGHSASAAGSLFGDTVDFCDNINGVPTDVDPSPGDDVGNGGAPCGIDLSVPADPGEY